MSLSEVEPAAAAAAGAAVASGAAEAGDEEEEEEEPDDRAWRAAFCSDAERELMRSPLCSDSGRELDEGTPCRCLVPLVLVLGDAAAASAGASLGGAVSLEAA